MPAASSATPPSAPSAAPSKVLVRLPVLHRTIVSQPDVLPAKSAAPLWRLNTSASILGAASPIVASPTSFRAGAQASPSTPRVSARVARNNSMIPPPPPLSAHGVEIPEGAGEGVACQGHYSLPSPMNNEKPDCVGAQSNGVSEDTGAHIPSTEA
ncbi:hypothetical protein C8Q78DRAFT_1080127 [Trametes maxima]|nr:hypothetical protein C8Q78DRAFT_1080127 [Trametes maxima]